jgi:hypothetical protein
MKTPNLLSRNHNILGGAKRSQYNTELLRADLRRSSGVGLCGLTERVMTIISVSCSDRVR